jgi:hypothetical protein
MVKEVTFDTTLKVRHLWLARHLRWEERALGFSNTDSSFQLA